MYRVSTRGQYALLIMTDLAEIGTDSFVPLKVLSHRRNLSVKYLEQILIHLGKAELVVGSRGTNGGYKLSRSPETYTVGEILRTMEGDISPRGTPVNNHLESVGNEKFWADFTKAINQFVDSVTLEQLAQRDKNFVGYEYNI